MIIDEYSLHRNLLKVSSYYGNNFLFKLKVKNKANYEIISYPLTKEKLRSEHKLRTIPDQLLLPISLIFDYHNNLPTSGRDIVKYKKRSTYCLSTKKGDINFLL